MPAILLTILATCGKVALSLLMSLISEVFLKRALVIGLEHLVKKTATDEDDKLLQAAKEAWGMKE